MFFFRELKQKASIFSNLDIATTFLFSNDSQFFKLKSSHLNEIKSESTNNINILTIKTFLFNLEVEKHFKLSEDLINLFSKLVYEKNLIKESKEIGIKINYLHALLFEIYSEILTDIFIFTVFIDALKTLTLHNPILLDSIQINSATVNFKSLSQISFIFQKIKKYIEQRDNNLHVNLEKIVIMIIEEIEINFLNKTEENQIPKENTKEEYQKYLNLKSILVNNSTETLNKIYFEAFELFNSNMNSNVFDKLNYLDLVLKEFEEPFFYGLFVNKTKANFICVLRQVRFFINLINYNYNQETSELLSNLFVNINSIYIKDRSINALEEGKSEENIEEKNSSKLLNSDYLVLNYMRINVLDEGKYIL